jgi:magnesium transporter
MLAYGPLACDEHEGFDAAALAELRRTWPRAWVHVIGAPDEALRDAIVRAFEVPARLIDDLLHHSPRPRAERAEQLTLVVARMVEPVGAVEAEQLCAVIGDGFLVTFEERPGDLFERLRTRLREGIGELREGGADDLFAAMFETIVDAYYPVIDALGDELDHVEDALGPVTGERTARRLRTIKHDLLVLRRALGPMREVAAALARDESLGMRPRSRARCRDVHDQIAQLLDITATWRELAADLVELQLALSSQRMNEVMKVLTVMATVFIPLTFICSIYGMNFNTRVSPLNMPELEWYWGYPFALGLMGVTAVVLLAYFRRRGWI